MEQGSDEKPKIVKVAESVKGQKGYVRRGEWELRNEAEVRTFGKRDIFRIDDIDKGISVWEDLARGSTDIDIMASLSRRIARYKAERTSILQKSQNEFCVAAGDPKRRRAVDLFLNRGMKDGEIYSEFERRRKEALDRVKDPEKRDDLENFLFGLSDPRVFFDPELKIITDGMYEKMLRHNVNFLERRREEFNQEADVLLAYSKKTIRYFAKSKNFYLNLHRLNRLRRGTQIYLVDSLLAGSAGFYDITTERINIGSNHLPVGTSLGGGARAEEVLVHEMIHFLAGRTVVGYHGVDTRGRRKTQVVGYQRTGVNFLTQNRRFSWLNEGMTESLTRQVLVGWRGGGYIRERELTELLLSVGRKPIDRTIPEAAYFENYDPNVEPGERIPEWKKFRQAVNEAYDGDFLVRLDKFVEKNGVDEAVRVMKEDWRKI